MTSFERRYWLLGILVPLAGVAFTLSELRYLMFSEVTDATIASVDEAFRMTAQGRRPNGQLVTVRYADPSLDEEQTAQGRFHALWKPEGDTLKVQYLPGKPRSGRLLEDAHPWLAIGILSATLLLAGLAIKFGLEAQGPMRKKKRKRRKR